MEPTTDEFQYSWMNKDEPQEHTIVSRETYQGDNDDLKGLVHYIIDITETCYEGAKIGYIITPDNRVYETLEWDEEPGVLDPEECGWVKCSDVKIEGDTILIWF